MPFCVCGTVFGAYLHIEWPPKHSVRMVLYTSFLIVKNAEEDTQNEEFQMLHNGLVLLWRNTEQPMNQKFLKPLESSVSDHRYAVIPSIPNVEDNSV